MTEAREPTQQQQAAFDAYRPHAGYQQMPIYEEVKQRTVWMDRLSLVLFFVVWGWGMVDALGKVRPMSPAVSSTLFLSSCALFLLARLLRWRAFRNCPLCRAPFSHWDHPTELLVVHFCDTCRIYTAEPVPERRES